jgi:outer membrane lipoprotein carrier protein
MKKILLIISFLLFCFYGNAQRKATIEQQHLMYNKITEATTSLKSLQCHFQQIKEVSVLNGKIISKGMMYYRQDAQLRWEYTSPYTYTFLINAGKVMMKSDKNKNIIDIRSSKLFQEITRIMMSSINGTGLKDSSNYTVNYYYGSSLWQIVLVPKTKVMRKMFSSITLSINPADYQVSQVMMTEKNGDKTIITLTNKIINRPINDEKFAIR